MPDVFGQFGAISILGIIKFFFAIFEMLLERCFRNPKIKFLFIIFVVFNVSTVDNLDNLDNHIVYTVDNQKPVIFRNLYICITTEPHSIVKMRVNVDKNLDKDLFHTIKTAIDFPPKSARNKISYPKRKFLQIGTNYKEIDNFRLVVLLLT